MNKWIRWIVGAVASLALVGGALAQERGTKDEAKALVDAAWEHVKKVGPEKAFKDFTEDKANWTKKDLYVMAADGKGITLAHGANAKLVGKGMLGVKDANGVAFMATMLELANSKGSGWVDYDWPHPVTKKIEGKSSYVRKLPSGDGFVGVGIYR
jgi:signal transduction histidine kinase